MLASACVQKENVSLMRVTRAALVSVAAAFDRAGAFESRIVPHRKSLPSERWITMSPNDICAGVGLKEYLSAGISSAAAMRFFATSASFSRNAVATGLFCANARAGARHIARVTRI